MEDIRFWGTPEIFNSIMKSRLISKEALSGTKFSLPTYSGFLTKKNMGHVFETTMYIPF